MALYRGNVKVSGIGQSFNPENTGTEGQVLTKTNSGYAYCDPQGGGGSDTYNIKYIVVGGGGAGSTNTNEYGYGGGGGAVCYGKIGFEDTTIQVKIGGRGYAGAGLSRCNGGASSLLNNDFSIIASGGGTTDANSGTYKYCYHGNDSGSGFIGSMGGGGAGGPGVSCNGGAGLCGYGGGGAGCISGTATDGGGSFCCNATNCGGGGGGHYMNGACGIVKICYACDGSGGINTATGGNSCYVCDGYCVHEFTSDGTFCITG